MNGPACLDEHHHEQDACEFAEGPAESDGHGHGFSGHHHGPTLQDSTGPRLLATLALNLIIPSAQIIGGLMANSVALISDAVHNFSDFTALLISYIAFRIGRR
ncbi:MAG: cation transporter, partial [Desulfobacterales bacterium]